MKIYQDFQATFESFLLSLFFSVFKIQLSRIFGYLQSFAGTVIYSGVKLPSFIASYTFIAREFFNNLKDLLLEPKADHYWL